MSTKVYNVLFLCSENAARSILAEGLLNVIGKGRFKAFSAGTQPAGAVSPFALELLEKISYDTSTLASKPYHTYLGAEAPQFDFIITVCDKASFEPCPTFPGENVWTHWTFDDPSHIEGDDQAKRAAFWRVYCQIQRRLELFTNLPIEKLDNLKLATELDAIRAS